ncbi:E3 ubiquitin-protein ligase RNF182-like [Python bivittatus]|uniref:E3 ubiquitin-protein ligase RNF182 n=1 Tax=Python bivittatus TaxID=176946 RepID=A0A9F2WF72_PYTBI|nr:E3 ubiquitin-protein ligase RNF182-like [Python bivittatus]
MPHSFEDVVLLSGAAMSLPKGKGDSAQPLGFAAHETECSICCESFDWRARRPKLLSCHHQVCARCLRRMADIGKSPVNLSCPFCRQETPVPDEDVGQLPDNGRVLALLCRQGGSPLSPEVLLCPSILEPFADGKQRSSDCLVITLLEVPEDAAAPDGLGIVDVMRFYRPPSLASLPCHGSLPVCQSCSTWRAVPRFFLGLLGLVYFSSLPLGIYLLLVERPNLGLVLVSLVPSTLLLCILYSLCQCVCQEVFDFPA